MKLYKFYADWCAPCKRISPAVKKFCDDEGIELVEINVEDLNEQELEGYKVRCVPTLVMYDGDNEVKRHVGDLTTKNIHDIFIGDTDGSKN